MNERSGWVWSPATYGEVHAQVFDRWFDDADIALATARFLAQRCDRGPSLELGIGTGRVALLLASRGIEVEGIDASVAMVDRLRAKPGGADIPVLIDDFAKVAVDRSFGLVFVLADTFFNLPDQATQVTCFQRVASRLRPGGRFVVDARVPDPASWASGRAPAARWVDEEEVVLRVVRHDAATQTVLVQHIALSDRGVQLYPNRMRYAWPAELDLMAEIAGLDLEERWAGWYEEAFVAESRRHVSVYRLHGGGTKDRASSSKGSA